MSFAGTESTFWEQQVAAGFLAFWLAWAGEAGVAAERRVANAQEGGDSPPVTFRSLRVIKAHRQGARCVDLSPDGKRLVSAAGKVLRVWDALTGKKLREGEIDGEYIHYVRFAEGGRTIVCASGTGEVHHLLDAGTLKKRGSFRLTSTDGNVYTRVAVSADGKIVGLSLGGSVTFWDVGAGKLMGKVLLDTKEGVRCMAFAPDGRTIAVAADGRWVRLCDVKRGKEVRKWMSDEQMAPAHCMAFSPDGTLLAVGFLRYNVVRVWDIAKDAMRHEFRWKSVRNRRGFKAIPGMPFAEGVYTIAFTPDGNTLAVASWDESVRLWELASDGLRCRADIAPGWLAFGPQGSVMVAKGGPGGTIRLWDWRDPDRPRTAALPGKALEQLWADCSAKGASVGYRAVTTLLGNPTQAVELFEKRLSNRPALPPGQRPGSGPAVVE
jgi:WD40 repeat protein